MGRWPSIRSIFFFSLIGLPIGVGVYAFIYARGDAYLSNNPTACVNCHVMQEQYDSWQKSSHHIRAVCNDCHTPGNFVEKYAAKASNGFWHSFAFTTQRFHEPIQIKAGNKAAVERACRGCHERFLENSGLEGHRGEDISCTRCHSSVGHAGR